MTGADMQAGERSPGGSAAPPGADEDTVTMTGRGFDAPDMAASEEVTETVSLQPSGTQDTVVLRESGEVPQFREPEYGHRRRPKPPTLPKNRPEARADADPGEPLDSVDALSREHLRSRLGQRDSGMPLADSPSEAMWQNELARYHHMIKMVLGVVGVSALTLPFLGGSAPIKGVLYATMAVLAFTCIWQRAALAQPERVSRMNVRITWLAAAATTCAAVAFFGIYSPAPIIMALELLLVGMTNDRLLTFVVYGMTAGFAALMVVLLGMDVITDPGLLHAEYLDQRNRLLGLILVEAILLAGLWIGLSTRREMMASFEKLYHAAQLVAQQRAMVREVRQDLQRAANVGGRGPLTGEVLGSFELGVIIGRGGMGEVYRAVHTETHEFAAIKVLQARAIHEPGAGARFAREVAVARSLDVPNIVRVLEVGGEHAVPYLAMEYLRGQDLAHYLRRRGHLSADKVKKLVREVGAGIHAAGQAGIVHRDIKPHNLFLAQLTEKERVWKILDFGVATLASHSGTLTQGRIIGTPAYMAPEQARGHAVDHRADLYALAGIAYRALTGHPPYSGDDLPSLLYRVVHEMPRRPTRLADLPAGVDIVLAVGMAKDPAHRFERAADLADALCAALDGELDAFDPKLEARAEVLGHSQPWR